MQPNGMFYISNKNNANISITKRLDEIDVKLATQSGPMLVIDGEINSHFRSDSKNIHIRNGVGILPSGDVLFAISTKKITFYKLATFFKSKGCKSALYLDGYVSRMYVPDIGLEQMDGNLGPILAIWN